MSDPLQELAKAARSAPARQAAQGPARPAQGAPSPASPEVRVEAQPLEYGRPEPGVFIVRLSAATLAQLVGWLATWVGLGLCGLMTLGFLWLLMESLFSGSMRPMRTMSMQFGAGAELLGAALFFYLLMMSIGAFVAVMGQMLLVLSRRGR